MNKSENRRLHPAEEELQLPQGWGNLEKKQAKHCQYTFSTDLIHIASNLRSFIQNSQCSLAGARPHYWNIELQKKTETQTSFASSDQSHTYKDDQTSKKASMETEFSVFLHLPALVIGPAKSSVTHSSPWKLRILWDSEVPLIHFLFVILDPWVNTAANFSQLS